LTPGLCGPPLTRPPKTTGDRSPGCWAVPDRS
jgi:hypothetical protein